MLVLGEVGGYEMTYHPHNGVLTYKEIACRLIDLLAAVNSPIDRIRVENTDLLLIKKQLTYKIGCLEISIEEFNKYKLQIKKINKNNG